MSGDAHVTLPPTPDSGQLKARIYQIRGETLAVGATVEWILGKLAQAFAGSGQDRARDRWDDLKTHIKAQDHLASELRAEMLDVGEYFRPRNLAAHAPMVIVGVGSSVQILRLRERGPRAVEIVTEDQLQAECARARKGHAAIQAIGRGLDDREPAVLGRASPVLRGIVLGRV